MGKIIIDNQSDLSDFEAVELVSSSISNGRVSNKGKQYCYCIKYYLDKGVYQVSSFLNKKSDRFVIFKES